MQRGFTNILTENVGETAAFYETLLGLKGRAIQRTGYCPRRSYSCVCRFCIADVGIGTDACANRRPYCLVVYAFAGRFLHGWYDYGH